MSGSHIGVTLLAGWSLTLFNIDTSYGQSPQAQTKAASAATGSNSPQSCDCARSLGSCKATVTFKNGELNIRSSSHRCSLVVFQVNGDPRTSIVVDGGATEQWLGDEITRLGASSCSVCADSRKGP